MLGIAALWVMAWIAAAAIPAAGIATAWVPAWIAVSIPTASTAHAPAGGLPPAHAVVGGAVDPAHWWTYWSARPEVALVLLGAGALYSLGWWRLRRRGQNELASVGRLAAYWGGLATLALALLGPLDALQSELFAVHMTQHMLIMMVAPILLLLGAPFPMALWGLPRGLRLKTGHLLRRGSRFRRLAEPATAPWLMFAAFTACVWLWHMPAAYDAVQTRQWVHDLEHLSFFLTALAYWWCVMAALPRLQSSLGYGLRMALVLVGFVQHKVLSIMIAMADHPLYAHYAAKPGAWGLSPLEDQMWGGVIMWIPGGILYVLIAVVLIARAMDSEERRVHPRRPGAGTPAAPPVTPATPAAPTAAG